MVGPNVVAEDMVSAAQACSKIFSILFLMVSIMKDLLFNHSYHNILLILRVSAFGTVNRAVGTVRFNNIKNTIKLRLKQPKMRLHKDRVLTSKESEFSLS